MIGYSFSFITIKNCKKRRTVKIILCLGIFVSNMFLCQANGWVDLNHLQLGNILYYFWFAVSTSICLLYVLYSIGVRNKWIEWIGRNSLIVLVTHLPFPITRWCKALCGILFNFNRYIQDMVILIMVMAVESLIILGVNYFLRKMRIFIKKI